MDEISWLCEILDTLPVYAVEVAKDPVACRYQCGPLTRLATAYLRHNGVDAGMLFVTGFPAVRSGHPDRKMIQKVGSAHYLSVAHTPSGERLIVDLSYRQFDPRTAWPLIYPYHVNHLAGHGWDNIEGVVNHDEPLGRFQMRYTPQRETEQTIGTALRELTAPHPVS